MANGLDSIGKTEGVSVILAGAGTGKTHAIVEKVKHLISEGIYPPEKIVCITFSNEAANNILMRVRRALNLEEGKEPIIKTFHAFSADLLRKHGDKIDIVKEFKVLDPDSAKVVLHTNFKIQPYYCHRYIASIGTAKDLGIKIEKLEKYISEREEKFKGVDLEKRLESLQFELQTMHLSNFRLAERDKKDKMGKKDLVREIDRVRMIIDLRKFISAWKGYEKIKKVKGYLDYSDLNNMALELLQKHNEISEEYDYIVVDEFQDTNKVQLDLLIALAGMKKNITIVGDLNQSIYRFRGAYKENFNEFKKVFNVSEKDVFNLDKSYRSSNKILRAAHKLILNNYDNPEDCFEVKNFEDREGEEIEVFELKDGREEARKVAEIVESEIAKGIEEEEICIMFRTHQQGRIIKSFLDMKGIDYCSVSKGSLLGKDEIKKVIDYLNILDKLKSKGKGGEQAWWDIVYRMGFEEMDLIKIGKFIKENREDECLSVKLLNELEKLDLSEEGKMHMKILIERIMMMLPFSDKEIEVLIKEIYRISGIIRSNKTKEEKEISLNLNKFYDLAKEQRGLHGLSLSGFVNYLDVIGSLNIDIEASELEKKGVRLMTSHSTKGLEYKTVIITSMAQKRFPIIKYANNMLIPSELNPELSFINDLDEEERDYFIEEYERKQQIYDERRLAYVGFTRAKSKLILTYSQNYGGKKHYPSQFLDEVRYKENSDFTFMIDSEEKFEEPELKIKTGLDISRALRARDFEGTFTELLQNAGKISSFEKDISKIKFSPSALLLFDECQKKYEYKYRYNMPDQKIVNWEAIRLGSFVHSVLEKGVELCFSKLKDFLDYAKQKNLEQDWESVSLEEAEHLIRIFYERNKNKYSERSKTEQALNARLGDLNFIGYADRIDFNENGEIEIIDYKTNKSQITGKARNWQLGYYALAAGQLGKVKKITLDMLRLDKPLEFELDDKGNAVCVSSDRMQGFNIYEVESELIQMAHKIQQAYSGGFKPCPIEKNCEFCNEYVYGL